MVQRKTVLSRLSQARPFGQPVNDPEAAYVNLYRKFGSAGQPVLISRVPVTVWNSSDMSITDFYSPTVEMEVSYELRAENGYGETSLPGSLRSKLLTPALLRAVPVAQPIIADAKIAKSGGNSRPRSTGFRMTTPAAAISCSTWGAG
ncbi:MAG: hypothetical protein ABIQ99_12195 [Thermoflexales bacterium]